MKWLTIVIVSLYFLILIDFLYKPRFKKQNGNIFLFLTLRAKYNERIKVKFKLF